MKYDPNLTREQNFLTQHTLELQTAGYLNHEGEPIGAGKHLIPLLLETFKATKDIFDHGVELMSLDVDEEPETDPNEIIKSFYMAIRAAVQSLQDDGYENPADLAHELILPHMDWMFCIQYACWSAMMNPIDVLSVDIRAFDENNPNRVDDILRAFLQVARDRGAKWSIKIAEKALRRAD